METYNGINYQVMVQAWVAKKLVNVTFYKFLRFPFLLWDPNSTRTATF